MAMPPKQPTIVRITKINPKRLNSAFLMSRVNLEPDVERCVFIQNTFVDSVQKSETAQQ